MRVPGPTAGVMSSMAESRAPFFTVTSTRSYGPLISPAVTTVTGTASSGPWPVSLIPLARTAAALAGRSRNVTSRPA